MITNNAINSAIPISVSQGGIGDINLTANGILVGATTAGVTQLAAATTGQLLVGATGSDPSFASSATGNFTFTSAIANTTETLTIVNTDNTISATSAANLQITVGGTNVSNPQKTYTITGGHSWSKGIANSASEAYKISASTALGTTDTFIMTKTGSRNLPITPSFLSRTGSTATDVTGDGTVYTVLFQDSLYLQQGVFTSPTFTAPVTGKYYFNFDITASGTLAAHTTYTINLVTTANTFPLVSSNPGALKNASGNYQQTSCVIALMSAGNTAHVTMTVSGSTKVISSPSSLNSRFMATLIC